MGFARFKGPARRCAKVARHQLVGARLNTSAFIKALHRPCQPFEQARALSLDYSEALSRTACC